VDPQAEGAAKNGGQTIIGHVANSGLDHPLIHIGPFFGIDFSVTKHVFMVWAVAPVIRGGHLACAPSSRPRPSPPAA
jgi:hypothetical protein